MTSRCDCKLLFSVRPELGGCRDGQQDDPLPVRARGPRHYWPLKTSTLRTGQSTPRPHWEHWGGWWSWCGWGPASNETHLLHSWSRRLQAEGNNACHWRLHPEKVTELLLSLDSSAACPTLILSSLQPFFLVTQIFLHFIKLEKLMLRGLTSHISHVVRTSSSYLTYLKN